MIRATPRGVATFSLVVIGLLVVAGIAARATILASNDPARIELARRFDLDIESNIPTWFASVGLLAAAVLFGIIALDKRRENSRYRWHWLGLSVIFVFLSIDEAVYMHELLIAPIHNALELGGVFFFAWVIPGAIGVLVFAMVYWRFLMHLPPRTRRLFALAGAAFAGGALVLESISGALVEQHGYESLRYSMVMMSEEILEMVGVALLNYALIDFMRAHPSQARIAFRD